MPRLLQPRSVFRFLSYSSILSMYNMNTFRTVFVASEKHMHVYIISFPCKFWLLVIRISMGFKKPTPFWIYCLV